MVMTMRRLLVACGVLGLLVASVFFARSATARSAASACPAGSGYPAVAAAAALVTTTTPVVGQTIEVSGSGMCTNEGVNIFIDAALVATAQTDGTGAFDPPVKVPGPAGVKTLRIVGASGLPNDSATVTLTVRASAGVAGVSASRAPTSNGGGGLASTGVRVALLALIAGGLIAGGVLLARSGRRKSSVHS